jgi:hypothetical protein
MASHWVKFTIIFVVAAALLFAGFFLAWYPSYKSEILKLNLSQNGLTQAERDNLQSSLSWWSNQGVYIYGSVANFILVGGFLVLAYAIVYSITSVWRESIKAKVTLEERRYVSRGEPEKQEPMNYPYEQTKKVKTGFPIAAGSLTIITSSIIMAFSGIFIVGGILTISSRSYQTINLLGDGLLGALVFGFALTAGIMILKRKNFVFSIIGLCFMLVKGTTFILVTSELVGVSLGIIIIAIAILSLIFTSISYKEFS